MNVIWIAVAAFACLVLLAAVVAGGVVLFLRLRAREPINVNLRFLFRVYLLVVMLAGLMVITQGTSDLLKAGLASVVGKQFSYEPVYARIPGPPDMRTSSALELKDRTQLTDAELKELSVIQAERQRKEREEHEERQRLGLDRAMKEGLIQGINFLVIGLAIWGSHFAGRRWLETEEERDSLLSRIYLTLVTITFGVITIVYLPQAVFETLSYVLLDPFDQYRQPGQKLSLSITALPIWLIYLWQAIQAIRLKANGS